MAFTLSAMGYSHGNDVYTHAVSSTEADCDNAAEESTCEAHFDATGQFKKAPKHHAPSGKIKIPRPGSINISYAHWQFNNLRNEKNYSYSPYNWTIASSALYLQNCVLLI